MSPFVVCYIIQQMEDEFLPAYACDFQLPHI